ncbi:nuclear transport factor 2 family protein [Streptacidiphilus sp. N1-10]|uniref:Nuclear transport factor 2 family protein n=1 Tax=Streptacidiphilus jeojiensis TaxID=3229225 RepID=A0ABV6XX71_9ACTN
MTVHSTDRELRQDVAELLVRYATGVDRRDWELFRSCFTDDCRADYGDIGTWSDADSFTAWMDRAHRRAGPSLHRVTNQTVTRSGDDGTTATARCYLDAVVMTADARAAVQTVGYCDDDLVRTDDGWRIARRRYTRLLSRTEHGADGPVG